MRYVFNLSDIVEMHICTFLLPNFRNRAQKEGEKKS